MSELDVSLPLFAERAGSLLCSTYNSNLHTKAAKPNAHASNAHKIHIGSSGLTHWKISVIREVECASYCNNSSPDDRSCLKFRLEDAKVHQVILHRSKVCVSNRKRVLKVIIHLLHF